MADTRLILLQPKQLQKQTCITAVFQYNLEIWYQIQLNKNHITHCLH